MRTIISIVTVQSGKTLGTWDLMSVSPGESFSLGCSQPLFLCQIVWISFQVWDFLKHFLVYNLSFHCPLLWLLEPVAQTYSFPQLRGGSLRKLVFLSHSRVKKILNCMVPKKKRDFTFFHTSAKVHGKLQFYRGIIMLRYRKMKQKYQVITWISITKGIKRGVIGNQCLNICNTV